MNRSTALQKHIVKLISIIHSNWTLSHHFLFLVISNLHGLLSICRTQKESFSLKRFLWSQQASSVSENVVVSIIKTFKLQTETISIKRWQMLFCSDPGPEFQKRHRMLWTGLSRHEVLSETDGSFIAHRCAAVNVTVLQQRSMWSQRQSGVCSH